MVELIKGISKLPDRRLEADRPRHSIQLINDHRIEFGCRGHPKARFAIGRLPLPVGWRSWFVAGLLHPWFRVQPRLKSVYFHDAENRQRPCRMIMRHIKNLQSVCLAWVLWGK
ncbi:hypothetical protein TNCV_3744861 [Trichonephila clavipes]|nr:hypothetical protein TNCV_3744861 [Trichonephila clavipes]